VSVQDLSYSNVVETTTISIGLCIVDSDSSLTNKAVVERANSAMRFRQKSREELRSDF